MKNKTEMICGCASVHEEVLERVRGSITDDLLLMKMSEIFKAMNDPTRLKIINALLLTEMCTCDMAAFMNMSQPAVSHHLKALRQGGLIKYRRDGKNVYYSLDDEHVVVLFKNALEHALEYAAKEK